MKEFFTFRLNRLTIVNSMDWIGDGELKILSFVTGENVNVPDLSGLLKTTDADKKKELIQGACQSVLSAKSLVQLDHVEDGHIATFGDTGYALYTANEIPVSFNWGLMLFDIDEDINDIGKQINNIINAPGYAGFVNNVLTLLSAAASPAAAAGVAIARFVFGVVADTMIAKKDDQVGLMYQSFNRFQDYPHGERKRDHVPDLSNNVLIDYSIFGTKYE